MPAITITETLGKMSTKYEFETFQDYEKYLGIEGGEVSLMGGGTIPPKQDEDK